MTAALLSIARLPAHLLRPRGEVVGSERDAAAKYREMMGLDLSDEEQQALAKRNTQGAPVRNLRAYRA
ncbi:hypothetical protein [Kribbella sp. NPDC048915]|uniref:hypothetical protein n=1 Tax=Kribbella sp. NPDC048915 TaxID=3155148 RepID=UPI0033E8A4EB